MLSNGMESLTLKFDGNPTPLQRPRFGARGKVYTPQKSQSTKRRMAIEALHFMKGRKLLSCPVEIEIHFKMKMPKSPKPHQREGAPHYYRPDLSNLIKLVEDALNEVVWTDDAVISKIIAVKSYSEHPCTVVKVKEIHANEQA